MKDDKKPIKLSELGKNPSKVEWLKQELGLGKEVKAETPKQVFDHLAARFHKVQ